MKISLYDKFKPCDKLATQIKSVAVSRAAELLIEGVPSTNGFYPWYQWGLSKEIEYYLSNIGSDKSGSEILLAFEDDNLERAIGFLLYTPTKGIFSRQCCVHYLAVEDEFSGKGLGTNLLKVLSNKFSQIELTCFPSKTGFYEKLGFKPIGTYLTQVVMSNTGKSVDGRCNIYDRAKLMASAEGRRNQLLIEQRLGHIQSINAMQELQSHMAQLMENIKLFELLNSK